MSRCSDTEEALGEGGNESDLDNQPDHGLECSKHHERIVVNVGIKLLIFWQFLC
jgi:hypothetical protein